MIIVENKEKKEAEDKKFDLWVCPECKKEFLLPPGAEDPMCPYCDNVKLEKKQAEEVEPTNEACGKKAEEDDVCPDCGKNPCECDKEKKEACGKKEEEDPEEKKDEPEKKDGEPEEKKEESIQVEIVEDTKIPGTGIVLEKGDKILVYTK